MFINIHIIPPHWRTYQNVPIFSYVWGFGVMRVQQQIVGWFKQAFHKVLAKWCRILHTSKIRKRRHKDPSCVRAPPVGLVIVVYHCNRCSPGTCGTRDNTYLHTSDVLRSQLHCGLSWRHNVWCPCKVRNLLRSSHRKSGLSILNINT